jgi:uncharacterized membrane protein
MWWGEFYLVLTLLTAGAVAWKGDAPLLRAMILIFAQWVVYNFLKDSADIWFTLSNQLVDVFLLFFFYANWFYSRLTTFAVLCLLFVARVLWHLANAMIEIDPYRYAAGNNGLYLLELLAVWVGLTIWKSGR